MSDQPFDLPIDDDGQRDRTPVTFVSLDPDGTVRFADDAWTELAGCDRAAVIGERFHGFLADGDAERFDSALDTIRTDAPVTCDLTLRGEAGERVPVRLVGHVETDADGSVDRIHCRLTPESGPTPGRDGPRSESVRQNALLRTLFDGLPVGILAETADRTVLAVNDELLSMFDIAEDRAEMVGADCVELAELASEEFVDPQGFVESLESRIDAGDQVLNERFERVDGRVFERSYLPIDLRSRDGHLWVYEDVTDQRARESELEIYERLVEVAPVGVFRTTVDGRVLTANQRLASILGYADESDLRANYEDLAQDLYVDPERRETFLERIQQTGAVEDFEYKASVRDGGRRWLSMNARLLDETDDGSRVITGFTWDVTDRKRHERQLAILGRILRHNLRNALTVIEGQAELLGSGQAESPNEASAKIADRANSLLRLADKERAIADLLQGSTECIQWDLSELAALVREAVLEEHPSATVRFECVQSAPVSVCEGFDKAIRELLDNAIRHSESAEPTVSLTVGRDEDSIEVTVADTGPGIPKLERAVLVGEVEESPLYHSSGIGLFLVRQLVHASNGTLSVEGNDPRGTVVTVRLPGV